MAIKNIREFLEKKCYHYVWRRKEFSILQSLDGDITERGEEKAKAKFASYVKLLSEIEGSVVEDMIVKMGARDTRYFLEAVIEDLDTGRSDSDVVADDNQTD